MRLLVKCKCWLGQSLNGIYERRNPYRYVFDYEEVIDSLFGGIVGSVNLYII